uniref:MATH domain-containing protein n=1 Tax=Caenorhabditis japonica TaxID=281687 RepID=A0A8R1IV48_CAEJA
MSNSDIVRKVSASKTLVHRMVIGDRENPKTVPQVVVQSPSPLDMLSKLYEEGFTTYQLMDHDMNEFNDRQVKILSAADTCTEMFGPQLVWRINNLQQQKNEAKCGANTTIFSVPFMSHRFGYKMMACACLFGDGSSAGKSLSVYVILLKGEFDATLEWPFNRIVKVSLLDQTTYQLMDHDMNEFNDRQVKILSATFPGSSLLRSNSTRPNPPLLSTITHDTTPPSNSAVTFSQDGFQPPPTIMPFTALLLLR